MKNNILIVQLNRSGTNLFGVLITQLIAWIWLFDFGICYILNQKYTVADGLFWRSPTMANKTEAKAIKDIDDFILTKLDNLHISPVSLNI